MEPHTSPPSQIHPASIAAITLIALVAGIYFLGARALETNNDPAPNVAYSRSKSSQAVRIPVSWDTLGLRMTEVGVIDPEKLETLYRTRGGVPEEMRALLETTGTTQELLMTEENAGMLLNLFWALGLANQSSILENGPMTDPKYGGAGRFASTGGWTLARGNAMDHYSRHPLVPLTASQALMVERMSKGIYRPCCDNSTHFPDCNHGMAMLGLLELMASQGMEEDEMYATALAVNELWFPEVYRVIHEAVAQRGDTARVTPRDLLGTAYASASGYRRIVAESQAPAENSGSSCSA